MSPHKAHPHRYYRHHPRMEPSRRGRATLVCVALALVGLVALGVVRRGSSDHPGPPGDTSLAPKFEKKELEAIEPGSGEHVRFVVIGDTRSRRGVNLWQVNKIAKKIVLIEPRPHFIIHTGDVTRYGGRSRSPSENPQNGESEYAEYRMAMLPVMEAGPDRGVELQTGTDG